MWWMSGNAKAPPMTRAHRSIRFKNLQEYTSSKTNKKNCERKASNLSDRRRYQVKHLLPRPYLSRPKCRQDIRSSHQGISQNAKKSDAHAGDKCSQKKTHLAYWIKDSLYLYLSFAQKHLRPIQSFSIQFAEHAGRSAAAPRDLHRPVPPGTFEGAPRREDRS